MTEKQLRKKIDDMNINEFVSFMKDIKEAGQNNGNMQYLYNTVMTNCFRLRMDDYETTDFDLIKKSYENDPDDVMDAKEYIKDALSNYMN